MATALLFVVWTAWLLIALWLLGLKRRAWLIAIFVPFAIVVLIARDHAWRPYLIGWLGVHALVSGYDALDARYRQINNADRASIDGSDRAGTALRRVLPPVNRATQERTRHLQGSGASAAGACGTAAQSRNAAGF